MLAFDTLKVLLLLPPIIIGLAFLAVCLWILLRQRPLLVRASALAWVFTIAASLIIIPPFFLGVSSSEGAMLCLRISGALILFLLVLAVHRRARGYYLIGITESAFRNSLRSALAELDLPFEETLSGFSLPTLNDRLQARVFAPLGTGGFFMQGRAHDHVHDQAARGVEGYLLRIHGGESFTAALVYGLCGLVILGMVVYQWLRF